MKQLRAIIVFVILCLGWSSAFAQDISTQGKEFWLSFMGNGYRTNDSQGGQAYIINQVLISGKRDCTGTIVNPYTGWSQSFFVRANNITTINNLESQAYVETSDNESIVNKGLHIVTTDRPSVIRCLVYPPHPCLS